MKLTKSLLRECARVALEQRGFTVELISGAGIVRGARLRAVKGSQERNIAVRTSLDREVGLMRRPNGHWATIPRMDEVIVVAPSEDESGSAEVLSFAPDAIIRVFDAALEARQKENPNFSPKAPIFMALDAASGGRYAVVDFGVEDQGSVANSRAPGFGAAASPFANRIRRSDLSSGSGKSLQTYTVSTSVR